MPTKAMANIVMTNIIFLKTHSSHDNEAKNSINNKEEKEDRKRNGCLSSF